MREIIPESDETLEHVVLVGDRLAVAYLHHAHARLAIFELDGRHVVDVELPGIGSVVTMAGRRQDEELFLTFETFVSPSIVLAVRMADGSVREIRHPALAWDPDGYVSEQVFVTSEDGTQVPLFLTRRRDVVPSGDVPALLHGYGGFHIPSSPGFKAEWLAWMERGGLLAVASLRGGGEYGKAWHDAGRRERQAERVRRLRRVPPVAGRVRLDPDRSGSRSAADRTAGCSSARRSPSIRSCTAPRSPRSG